MPDRIPRYASGVERIVVKVGTRLLVKPDETLDYRRITDLVRQLSELHERGMEVILVSSGAVGAGMRAMGLEKRPSALAARQALAAVGQGLLVHEYEKRFQRRGIQVAQVLLSLGDLDDRQRFLNARRTLNQLLEWRVLPIINENDTVAVDELRFGDNDFLSAIIAAKVQSDLLVLLTDVDGLYSGDPKKGGTHIPIVDKFTDEIRKAGRGPGGETSMGGMRSKVAAAELATKSGKPAAVANGRSKDILLKLLRGEAKATWFLPGNHRLRGRKLWLALAKRAAEGFIEVDDGAARVVQYEGRSLLPIGVRAVEGQFHKGDLVRVCTQGDEVARGLVDFDSEELSRVMGRKLPDIEKEFGQSQAHEVIHRDNLVVTGDKDED